MCINIHLIRGVNLVWKLGVSWLQILKLGGCGSEEFNRWMHVAQNWGYHSQNFFKYMQISPFLESHHFWKCSHLKFLYITGYNWDPTSQNLEAQPTTPRIDAYVKNQLFSSSFQHFFSTYNDLSTIIFIRDELYHSNKDFELFCKQRKQSHEIRNANTVFLCKPNIGCWKPVWKWFSVLLAFIGI